MIAWELKVFVDADSFQSFHIGGSEGGGILSVWRSHDLQVRWFLFFVMLSVFVL